MKKILSILYILVFVVQNIITINPAWAASNITVDTFTVKVNSWNATSWDSYAVPWDILSFLVNWTNQWDTVNNIDVEFNFSSNQFNYYEPWTVSSYVWWSPVNSNIATNLFNPPSDNTAPITTVSNNWDVIDLYYTKIQITSWATSYNFSVWARFIWDSYNWTYTTRNIYVNVRPHITDYYFEKADWSQTTNQIQWSDSEQINLVLKVKDYNGCANIDWWTIRANLSQLWLSTTEPLTYASCDADWKTAIFKKTWITTMSSLWTYNFDYNNFTATDEDGNVNTPSDPNTTFDDEDKKSTTSLTVIASNTPRLSVVTEWDYTIWWPLKPSTTISFTWSQDWSLKVARWSDWTCSGWTTISDWTVWYLSWTTTSKTILSSSLVEWANSVYICLKNWSWSVWSLSKTITVDTVAPTVSNPTITPASVTTWDSNISFNCSENWTYQVERWWSWVLNAWTFIWSWSATAGVNINQTILNSKLNAWSNTVYWFCIDWASNNANKSWTVTKTSPALSMSGKILSFWDNDVDYDWLDGKDISVSWDNSWVVWSNFESYRIFLLPSNITLNTSTHTYIKLVASWATSNFTWDSSITKDSTNTNLVSWASYKVCIAIMWTDWIYWTAWCGSAATIVSDTVQHPTILSAKFTALNNLELTTDATLDTATWSHSWWLVTFQIWWTTYTWTTISSINSKKINVTIPNLPSSSSTWSNLLIQTWSIRSWWGWFNNYFSSWWLVITDWISPTISTFSTWTVSSYWWFYSWTLSFNYSINETIQMWWNSYIEFARSGWNNDVTRLFSITDSSKINSWSYNISVDLAWLWLVSWAYYDARMVVKDLAWNTTYSSFVSWIKFDSTWPTVPVITTLTSLSTLTPTFDWAASIDDNWYWAWVKNYKITIYNTNSCSVWNTLTWTTLAWLTFTLASALPTNDHDYCWNIYATDNMWNVWWSSSCNSFHVNTFQPVISWQLIKDATINSTNYAKSWDNIEVSANITSTDSTHIWANLSSITWNSAYNNVNCATPWTASITCTYSAWLAKYSFVWGFSWSVSSWVKQIWIYAQNTSWLNQTSTSVASITFDNTSPSISASPITAPTGGTVWWWTSQNITWTTSNITDNIWIDNLKFEYSTDWWTTWNLIWTSANAWTYAWNTTSLTSWANYKVRMTIYDMAWNNLTSETGLFTIDKTPPTIAGWTITSPTSWSIHWWWKTLNITWTSGNITDSNLNSNWIKLEYSLDNWTNWTQIAQWQPNNWTYAWSVPWSVNVTQSQIRLTAFDNASNSSSQTSSNFVIDSTLPTINVTFAWNGWATPSNWSYINNSWIDISWWATDTYLDKMQYSLQNLSDSTYRNTSWAWWLGSQSWNTICQDATSNWTSTNCTTISQFINPTWITNWVSYRLTVKSTDEATNEKLYNSVDYIWDTVWPNVAITTASWSYFSWSINIAWTSSDATSWISSVNIEIKKWSSWWDWSSWSWAQVKLLTTTSNSYANWNYNFSAPAWDSDWQNYDIIVTGYDKAYKTNNSTSTTSLVKLDKSAPTISLTWFWIHPTSWTWEIVKWWQSYTITWSNANITDNEAWLWVNPIKLEYFDWSVYQTITWSTANDWSHSFTLPSLDTDSSIRLTATDSLWNSYWIISPTFTIDSTPPTIARVETIWDTLGQISWLNVYFSEIIDTDSISIWDFSVAWSTLSWVYVTSLNSGWTWSILKINFDSSTWTTASTPTLVYNWTSIKDRANNNLANTSKLSVDAVYPVIDYNNHAEAFDIWNTWKINQIKVYFSESMQASSDTSAWVISNPLDITSVSLNNWNNYALLTISWSTSTSSSGINLQFNPNSNYKDSIWNYSNSIIVTPLNIDDKAKPRTTSAITNWANWVSSIGITFSESLTWALNSSEFSVSWATISWSLSLDATKTILTIPINIITDTSFTPIISYSWSSLKDDSNNVVNNFSITASDWVKPSIISRETQDLNHNGQIDWIKIAFSENLNTNTWWIVASVWWYSINNYSINSNYLLVSLQELWVFDTNATPSIQITSNWVNDLVWNYYNLEWSPTNATDKVGPVISNTRFDWTDKIYVTFSENFSWSLNNSSFVLSWATSSISSVTATSNTNTWIVNLTWSWITYGTSEISFASGSVWDIYSNKQVWTNFIKLSATVVINEIMWSNTWSKANQYIELRNLWTTAINLNWWKIKNAWADITLAWTIWSNWLFLVTKSDTNSSILSWAITPDQIAWSMDISTWSTLNVEDNNGINFDSAYISWNIWDNDIPKSMERNNNPWNGTNEANWYTAVFSTNFDSNTSKWTPQSQNVSDNTSPSIDSYSPTNNILFPTWWNIQIRFNYSDVWWIDINSYNFILQKNDWAWVFNTITNTNLTSSWVDTSSWTFNYSNLSYWQYKATFSISDVTWNNTNQVVIFYIDKPELIISAWTANLWLMDPNSWSIYYTQNVTVTVKTVWAWINLSLWWSGSLEAWINTINPWNGTKWFWFSCVASNYWNCTGWARTINNTNIDSSSWALEVNWNQKSYTYDITYQAKINAVDTAWIYSAITKYQTNFDY